MKLLRLNRTELIIDDRNKLTSILKNKSAEKENFRNVKKITINLFPYLTSEEEVKIA